MKNSQNHSETSSVPDTGAAGGSCLLGMPGFKQILTTNESASDYEALFEACHKALAPQDIIERIRAQSFVDSTWQLQRLHRAKTLVLQIADIDSVEKLLIKFNVDGLKLEDIRRIAVAWSNGDDQARKCVNQLLENNGLSPDAVTAQSTLDNLDDLEMLNKLSFSDDYRRDAAIRELEKSREGRGKRARVDANSLAQDADVEILDAPKQGASSQHKSSLK